MADVIRRQRSPQQQARYVLTGADPRHHAIQVGPAHQPPTPPAPLRLTDTSLSLLLLHRPPIHGPSPPTTPPAHYYAPTTACPPIPYAHHTRKHLPPTTSAPTTPANTTKSLAPDSPGEGRSRAPLTCAIATVQSIRGDDTTCKSCHALPIKPRIKPNQASNETTSIPNETTPSLESSQIKPRIKPNQASNQAKSSLE
nr:gibberellin-regulated protein 14-like [Penaeus vannamei]